VVRLHDEREAAGLEPFDRPRLPERLSAIELLGHRPRGEALERPLVAPAAAAPCGARGSRSGSGRRPPTPGDPRRAPSRAAAGSAESGGGATRCRRAGARCRCRPRAWPAGPASKIKVAPMVMCEFGSSKARKEPSCTGSRS
jgi:hypothetical protein